MSDDADKLYPYDPSEVPGIFKLESFGFFCYMNSLLQGLVSLSSVNSTLRKLDASNARNNLIAEMVKFINNKNRTVPELPISNVKAFFGALKELQHKRGQEILQYGKQEDTQEGLTTILDALGPMVSRHFEIRYVCEIICTNVRCGHRSVPGDAGKQYTEPSEIMIDLGRTDVELNTQKEVQDYLRRHEQYPRDYRCEKCGNTNTTRPGPTPKSEVIVAHNVMQRYSLRRLNEVIVLYFKKYNDVGEAKELRYFPPALDFKAKQGILHYEPVAQLDHSGSIRGGHYVARVRRPKPIGFQEIRDREMESLLSEGTLSPEAASRKQAQLHAWRQAASQKQDIFLLNDTEVKYAGRIVPVENTYMVFYHLVSIIPSASGIAMPATSV